MQARRSETADRHAARVESRHARFILSLEPRLWERMTDGGPALQRGDRARGRRARAARRRNR